MNWIEVTQSHNSRAWHVAKINYFPEGHASRFQGFTIGQPVEKTLFADSELVISFWAVSGEAPAVAATLHESGEWLSEVGPLPPRPDLHTRFPDVPHAERGAFRFAVPLDLTQPEYQLDIHLDMAGESIWFASLHLVAAPLDRITPEDLHPANQVAFLRQWATKKGSAEKVATTCAQVVAVCGEHTPPAIYAILGDVLEAQNRIEPAIAAYREAVERQPQEHKFEMRLSQLIAKRPVPKTPAIDATPKGISLSTSGDTALTIIVDMLYRSTPAYMYARELFQNELDAIYRRWDKEIETTGQSDFTGVIRIGPDASDPRKLCFWGDGIGMTFEQVTNHLAKLVNSGHLSHTASNLGEPTAPGNFGIGAKTSALPENTLGMVYKTLSLGESEGIEFALWKNPDNFLYEIKAWNNDGKVEHFRRVPLGNLADVIQRRGSGTSSTLLGNTPDEDTFQKSENLLTRQIAGQPQRRGIVYFLNSRYFTLPSTGLDVRVAERDDAGALCWHEIPGQKALLESHAEQSGSLAVSAGGLKATAHWWILREDAKEHAAVSNLLGHVGLLWKNEIYYNLTESQRAHRLHLNGFGIHFGEERVVIYIEPSDPDSVDSHPSRTKLMFRRRDLNPWEFGESFAANMPPELEAYQKSFLAGNNGGDSLERIKENLKSLRLDQDAKMREYAQRYLNRGKRKPEAKPPAERKPSEALPPEQKTPPEPRQRDFHIPACIWREFDPETGLFAAEWDSKGYVIKFNTAWPQYRKTLELLLEDAQADHPGIPEALLSQTCEDNLRFEYFKTVVEILFSSYSMLEYSEWTDRMVESQLLSPAGLSVVLQATSNLRTNVKAALAEAFVKPPEAAAAEMLVD